MSGQRWQIKGSEPNERNDPRSTQMIFEVERVLLEICLSENGDSTLMFLVAILYKYFSITLLDQLFLCIKIQCISVFIFFAVI